MEPAAYLAYLDDDAHALLAAAWTDPMLTVPTCPDWTLSDLVAHVGGAFHWVEEMVRTGAADFTPVPERPEPWDDVSKWFEEGRSSLLETLSKADPMAPVWNWVVMGAGPASFWYRRMAHEASVHRWDAVNAVHRAEPIDVTLASDGIDEYLTIAARWLELVPQETLAGSLGLEATDSGLSASVVLAPNSLERLAEPIEADCVVRGRASDLLLWLVGRKALLDEALEARGDVSVAARWAEVKFG